MTQPPRPPQGPRQGSSGDERTVITGGNFGKSVPARVPGRSVPPAPAAGGHPGIPFQQRPAQPPGAGPAARPNLGGPSVCPQQQYPSADQNVPSKRPNPLADLPRKHLMIGAGAIASVVLLIVVISSLSGGGVSRGGKATNAGDAVKSYLEALAAGDASRALSYGADTPGSKDFLTDEVLKQQIAVWPITDIQILETDVVDTSDTGRVHASAKFGDRTSDEQIYVKRVDGGWKVQHSSTKLKFENGGKSKIIKIARLFGKSVEEKQQAYVFPGFIDLRSSSPNIDLIYPPDDALLKSIATTGETDTQYSLKSQMSDKGKEATQGALKGAVAVCAQSKQLDPPNCPQGFRSLSNYYVDGTVTWTAPDISGMECRYDPYELNCSYSGLEDWPYSVDGKDYNGTPTGKRETGSRSGWMYTEKIDLTQTEVKIVWEKQ
ncbi:Lumazine-binding domain [Mycobacteroides abscessus subsp. abscessus]|nr:hypothetical protein [Mycobacteroides abscessus]SHU77382.1 Lumazine-binding domain [Mycobacteroides abscessus subsp. abscessus]SHW05231.1 Lumazine-binding domain [Mycobacteroides abscessus subsp. abscessus]SID01941.1 Lumazine-binding domain [Mycobacteroides abscessus subsp. abscessus]SIG80443.1 Lumazine-binding domain [Mycobacteroides abscessus subsp. abscessus]